MLLLLVGCAPDPDAVRLTPAERLDAALPGLAAAVARYTDDPEPIADVVEAADPQLVRLLLPIAPDAVLSDATAESSDVDLLSAGVRLDGTVLSGTISGRGVRDGGGWLNLDTKDGPSPDLHLGFGDGWIRASAMESWTYGPEVALAGESKVEGDTVRFRVDLAATGMLAPGHAGAVTAIVKGEKGWDYGPAGELGRPDPHAVAVLVALAEDADPMVDPDLALAVALDFGTWRGLVAPEVVATVEDDAVGWYKYGIGLDDWLADQGAGWTLASQPALAKLLWAWPGGETMVQGALPVSQQGHLLDRESYRFDVTDAETLKALRDMLPLGETAWETASQRDDAIWGDLRYRASESGMKALCAGKALKSNTCAQWRHEQDEGFNLGVVDGKTVTSDMGVSASFQIGVHHEHRTFIGDCGTATALATAAYQAVGLVPLSLGYAGPTFEWPTHNFPLFLDGERFFSPQATPSEKWHRYDTFAYATIPVLDPVLGAALGSEPGGYARGGAVAGGRLTYGALGMEVDGGVPLATVTEWVLDAREGDWPELK